MSKRIMSLCLAVMTLTAASNAFASRARELVMGTADPFGILSGDNGFNGAGAVGDLGTTSPSHGSFYYDDNYNVFYNPAYANDFKNWVSIEKSNGVGNTAATGSRAEGGFIASTMNWSLGLYFDRAEAIPGGASGFGAAAGTGIPRNQMRPVDVIIAADMGIKWGVGFTYGSYKAGPDNTATDATIRAGAQIGDLEPFANVKVASKDKTGPVENKYSGWGAGARYHYGEWVPFIGMGFFKQSDPTVMKNNAFGLGLGRNAKIGEGARLNYAVSYWRGSSAGRNIIPVNMSAEVDLASWITARAGLDYRFWDRTNNVSNADSTSGRLGASLHFNKVSVDWAVGGGNPGAGANPDSSFFDIGSGFFTAASLTYAW